MISKAMEFATWKHRGQKDDAGKDYFESHILGVVGILMQVTDNPTILAAAYLHDTLEDTDTIFSELVVNFNFKIASLVEELTHEGKKDEYGYFFPCLHSKEAILIKFADRLSNLSRMEPWDADRQAQYLKKSVFWKNGKDKK